VTSVNMSGAARTPACGLSIRVPAQAATAAQNQ